MKNQRLKPADLSKIDYKLFNVTCSECDATFVKVLNKNAVWCTFKCPKCGETIMLKLKGERK